LYYIEFFIRFRPDFDDFIDDDVDDMDFVMSEGASDRDYEEDLANDEELIPLEMDFGYNYDEGERK
jgi:hypothetical protein